MLLVGFIWPKGNQILPMYPCSTKTREVLGNPSPTPKRFPETPEISRGQSPREIPRVEGCKTHGRGKSRGRRGWISQYLPSLGGVRTFSHHQTFYREWISKSFPADREGLTVLKSILPCWWWGNEISMFSVCDWEIRRTTTHLFWLKPANFYEKWLHSILYSANMHLGFCWWAAIIQMR